MLATEIPRTTPDPFSRCEESSQIPDPGKSRSPSQKADAAIKEDISRAFRKDDVLRAIEHHAMEVHVKNGVVYLNGHIASMTSKSRIEKAIGTVPRIAGIQNELVLDDRLTLKIAAALGRLEQTYGCKFFTGVTHGVVSLNGVVKNESVKLLAEKSAASHPHVRGVMNNVRVAGAEQEIPVQPFLQPSIGGRIYFLDGVTGIVKQVIINPNNQRVIAMTVWAKFANQQQALKSLNSHKALSPERLVVIPMDFVRHMTGVSGFLHINSNEQKRYMDFDSGSFRSPNVDWTSPYPYCPDDVLFPVENRKVEYQTLEQLPRSPFLVAWVDQPLSEELLANDSLGG
jgi:osmotically-inducible protein OsmY